MQLETDAREASGNRCRSMSRHADLPASGPLRGTLLPRTQAHHREGRYRRNQSRHALPAWRHARRHRQPPRFRWTSAVSRKPPNCRGILRVSCSLYRTPAVVVVRHRHGVERVRRDVLLPDHTLQGGVRLGTDQRRKGNRPPIQPHASDLVFYLHPTFDYRSRHDQHANRAPARLGEYDPKARSRCVLILRENGAKSPGAENLESSRPAPTRPCRRWEGCQTRSCTHG